MTGLLFRDDAYLAACAARVVRAGPEGIELDRTVFYAASGGQPGDSGWIEAGGREVPVTGAVHPGGDRARVLHLVAEGTLAGEALPQALAEGAEVALRLDWARRHRLMRMHTALHLLSVVLAYPVTGGAIGEGRGRLDFDMAAPPDDPEAVAARLRALVAADLAVSEEWITEGELARRSDLVKTMKVKPPAGAGRVRLVRIGAGEGTVDLQPCGGTHVCSTAEIGALALGRIEKKGRQNRRVHLHLAS
ncbi:alanyl-tRNA editing protein [soil metagenome]